MDQKQDPTICVLNKNQFQYKNKHRVKVHEWRKIYHSNSDEKKVRVFMLILDRSNFRARKVVRHKKEALQMTKASNLQEDITILNMCLSSNRALKYKRQKLIKLQGETDESTVIVGVLDTPPLEMERSSKQNIIKGIFALDNTINQLDIMDIYKLNIQQQNTHSSLDIIKYSPT